MTSRCVQGFNRNERLLNSRQFKRVLESGRLRRTAHFRIYVHPTEGARKLGLTVSRRVGKAVRRNWLKRRIREFFRIHKSQLPQAEMVVIARPGSAGLSYHRVAAELAPALLEEEPR